MLIRVALFYVLAFAFTMILGGAQQAAQVSAETAILPQCGPALAALLMLLFFRKDQFRIVVLDRKVPASRYLFAALLPAGGALLVYAIYRLLFGKLPSSSSTTTPWILLLWFPLGAVGEELGWRGYLHKRLNAGLSGLVSSFVVGALWALWHVGMYRNGALYVGFFVLLMISYSLVIYPLVADIHFNPLVAAIFHLMINVSNLFTYSIVNQVGFMAVSSMVWAGIAALVILSRISFFTSRQLSSKG